jgi:hypothetical protein
VVDERENSDKCSSVVELKSVTETNKEWLKERGINKVS